MAYHTASRSTVAPSFSSAEWDLLVRLPGRVLIAATTVAPDQSRRGVPEGLAGIEAIATGRTSASRLISDIVAVIFAEQLGEGDPWEFADPRSGIANVLVECRVAARTLENRVSSTDAAAYRAWLIDIATTACAGAPAQPVERRFLVDLALALTV
jgi:hypothetical protein